MTRARQKEKDLGRRPDIEQDLTSKYHVGWSYVTGVSPSQFDIEKSLTNQARYEAIDEPTAEQYREAVERGDHFPAVIAYRQRKGGRLVIIDGNHRLVAHERAGAPLDVYEIESGTRGQQIALMTFAFNTRHGRPTSESERSGHALYLIENGASLSAAASAVNVPERIVKRALAKANADRRAAEVGGDPREWDALAQSTRARLLNIGTDEGFKDAIHLAYAAKLGADEVFDLVALLNASGKSATKHRQLVKQQTEHYADRIQAGGGGVLTTADRRSQTPKQRLSLAMGQLLALPDDVNVFTRAFAEGERHDKAVELMNAVARLSKIAQALDPSVA